MPSGYVGSFEDIAGRQFNQLTAMWPIGYRGKQRKIIWLCACTCGKYTVSLVDNLKRGRAKDCHRCSRLRAVRHLRKHGHALAGASTPTYHVWQGMLARCGNPNNRAYSYYGGRGISVCDRWLSFPNFLADMGEKPDGLSIDRFPNNDGNYEPGNCRWATVDEQAHNRRGCLTPVEIEQVRIKFKQVKGSHARMPSGATRALAREFDVSTNTIRRCTS